ncbi:MAG: hypothetical protein AB1700_05365 [Bacillota bacterium]
MLPSVLRVELLSDTTCGNGEGTPGEVDIELEHDHLGLPVIGGKALHGVLRETWLGMSACFPELSEAGRRVFGLPGAFDEATILHIGNAELPADVRWWVEAAVLRKSPAPIAPGRILRAFTGIRRQTSESRTTGSPKDGTLRSSRVAIRGLSLEAPLTWCVPSGCSPTDEDLKVLAMAALGSRHIGLARNRGRGHVKLSLLDESHDVTRRLARVGGES